NGDQTVSRGCPLSMGRPGDDHGEKQSKETADDRGSSHSEHPPSDSEKLHVRLYAFTTSPAIRNEPRWRRHGSAAPEGQEGRGLCPPAGKVDPTRLVQRSGRPQTR